MRYPDIWPIAALFLVLVIASAALGRKAFASEGSPGEKESPAEPMPFPSMQDYERRRVEGWSVLVSRQLLRDHPQLAEEGLKLLRNHLLNITRSLPKRSVEKLHKIVFWLEEKESHTPCMAYHPNADWLRDHGMNPRKAQCVEIANIRNFLDWSRDQPSMILHELAHAYHHQFLKNGFDNGEVKEAYQRAMKARLYDSVLRINGNHERAYAATNCQEFFAEESESLFGTNDFYPFVRAELKEYDPKTFALLTRLWLGD